MQYFFVEPEFSFEKMEGKMILENAENNL